MMSMKSHLIHIFLFLYESTLLRNWYQSNRIIQLKLWHFHAKLVNLSITLGKVCITHFSGVLASYLTLYLCIFFKDKVLRVLLQLESPNLEHRNSRYDLDSRDYSMFKLMQNLA